MGFLSITAYCQLADVARQEASATPRDRHSPCGTATEQAARKPAGVRLNAASMSPRFARPRPTPASSLMIASFDT